MAKRLDSRRRAFRLATVGAVLAVAGSMVTASGVEAQDAADEPPPLTISEQLASDVLDSDVSTDGMVALLVRGERGGARDVLLIDRASGEHHVLVEAAEQPVQLEIGLSDDGETAVVAVDKLALIFERDGSQRSQFDLLGQPFDLDVAGAAQQVAAVYEGLFVVHFVDEGLVSFATDAPHQTSICCWTGANAVSVSDDGSRIALHVLSTIRNSGFSHSNILFDLKAESETEMTGGSPITISSDGSTAVWVRNAGEGSGILEAIDLETGEVDAFPTPTGFVPGVYFHAAHEHVSVSASGDLVALATTIPLSSLDPNESGDKWPENEVSSQDAYLWNRATDELHFASLATEAATPIPQVINDLHVGDSSDELLLVRDRVLEVSNQVALCDGQAVTVHVALGQRPTGDADVILGSAAADTIRVTPGDVVCAGGGDDRVIAPKGLTERTMKVWGGEGNDRLVNIAGDVRGGPGNDLIKGALGPAYGEAGRDKLVGTAGDDVLYGGSGHDKIFAKKGDDILNGGTGRDRLIGGPGDDRCEADADDRIRTCESDS